MASMHISLPDGVVSIIEQKLASGMYANAGELISEAVRNFSRHHDNQLNHLKTLLAPSLQQAATGDFSDYSYDALMAEMDRKIPTA